MGWVGLTSCSPGGRQLNARVECDGPDGPTTEQTSGGSRRRCSDKGDDNEVDDDETEDWRKWRKGDA